MDTNTIEQKIDIPNKLKAPLKESDVIGTLSYSLNGITYKANLVAANDVKASHLFLKFSILFVVLLLLLIVYKLRMSKLKKKRINMIKRF